MDGAASIFPTKVFNDPPQQDGMIRALPMQESLNQIDVACEGHRVTRFQATLNGLSRGRTHSRHPVVEPNQQKAQLRACLDLVEQMDGGNGASIVPWLADNVPMEFPYSRPPETEGAAAVRQRWRIRTVSPGLNVSEDILVESGDRPICLKRSSCPFVPA